MVRFVLRENSTSIEFGVAWILNTVKSERIEECLRPIADRAMRKTPKRVPVRACTGFDGGFEAGEAIRMQCVKWQT